MGRTQGALAAVAVVAGLGVGAEAAAQTAHLDLQLNDARIEELGLDVDAVTGELEGLITEQLRLGEVQAFMDSMAAANAISTKGMGVDYASNPEKFVIGGSLGSGAHDAGFRFGRGEETLPAGGFAAQVALMAGVNLGGLLGGEEGSFGRRFLVYAHGLSMPLPSGSPLGGSMYNVGAHLQVRLANPLRAGVTEWGGLALTGGFERSAYVLRLRDEMPLATTVGGVDLSWGATGEYELRATNDAIPIELSTNLRVLVVTVFAGGGVDLDTGSSFAAGTLGGPVTASAHGETLDVGTATVGLEARGLVDEAAPRLFAGAQVNVLPFKVYAQLNVGLNRALGGHVGARLAF